MLKIKQNFLGGIVFLGTIIIGYYSYASLSWTNLATTVNNETPMTASLWNNAMINIKNNVDSLATNYFIKQAIVLQDTTTYSFGTTWGLGPNFTTVSGFKAGSLVKITYNIPARNDSTSWGGGYVEPQISFDGGTTWNSLGSSGYDLGVMKNGRAAIGSYTNTLLINPNKTSDFSVKIRMYFRSYDGTLTINGSNNINNISGTATLMAGGNGTQHYAKIILEELATY